MSSLAAFVIAASAFLGQAEEEKLPPGKEKMQQLEFLIGVWESEGEDGEVFRCTFEWMNNESYILCVAGDYREIFGWDLTANQIVCWAFGSHGGQGKFYWTREGDTWKGQAKTPFLDRWGKEMGDIRTIEILDKDRLRMTAAMKPGGKNVISAEVKRVKSEE